jgi:LAS superfamily LD-carboxypeptidase LdcB
MQFHHIRSFLRTYVPSIVVFVVLGVAIVYGYIQILSLQKQVKSLSDELAFTNSALSQKFSDLNLKTSDISNTLSSTQQNIDAVKNQVGGVEQVVGSISGTVGTLQKLAEVDPEILKKYSKVYFMNENYVPVHLTAITQDYVYSSIRQEQFLSEAIVHLNNMLLEAKVNSIELYVASAYRSFAEQKSLKNKYSVTYGAGTANAFSADQGYSEHQLGTTLDFITKGQGGKLEGFDTTQAFAWLQANAYRHGFVLSYPKGNMFYVYEPWHWRFVGVKLATYLHDTNKNFYDLDQREIDKYLASTFD